MKLKLVDKKIEASGTKSFFWEPERPVRYLPGQFYYWTLPELKYPDSRGATRHFTISASPTEGDLLRFTTRMRKESGYKKSLDEIKIGTILDGEGPNGTFIIDEKEDGPHVLLAGGIGITPYRSILKYAIDKNLPTKFHLLYSSSVPEELVFRKELEEWMKTNPNIKGDMTITKPEEAKEKWKGLTGRIDEKMFLTSLENWKLDIGNFRTWVSGPPAMVQAMQQVLGNLNVPANHIRSEEFTGY